MNGTNDFYHCKLQMKMYALETQSGTTELYHSWAGLTAMMTKFHGTQEDSSAWFYNDLGKAHAQKVKSSVMRNLYTQ